MSASNPVIGRNCDKDEVESVKQRNNISSHASAFKSMWLDGSSKVYEGRHLFTLSDVERTQHEKIWLNEERAS